MWHISVNQHQHWIFKFENEQIRINSGKAHTAEACYTHFPFLLNDNCYVTHALLKICQTTAVRVRREKKEKLLLLCQDRSLKYTQKTHGCECKLTFFASISSSSFHSESTFLAQTLTSRIVFRNFGQTNNSFILGRNLFLSQHLRVQQFQQRLTWLFPLVDETIFDLNTQTFSRPISFIAVFVDRTSCWHWFFGSVWLLPASPRAEKSLCLFLFTFLAFLPASAKGGKCFCRGHKKIFKSIKTFVEMICLLWEKCFISFYVPLK